MYGCVTWSPCTCHYDKLRRAHLNSLTRWVDWKKNNRTYHTISCLGTLMKTVSESIEAIMRRRRTLFAGFVARMEDTRLPKCVMFGELVEGAGCVGGREMNGWGVFKMTAVLSALTSTSRRWLQPRTRGNGARRRNASWRNGSLQRKPGLRLRHVLTLVSPNVVERHKKRMA